MRTLIVLMFISLNTHAQVSPTCNEDQTNSVAQAVCNGTLECESLIVGGSEDGIEASIAQQNKWQTKTLGCKLIE